MKHVWMDFHYQAPNNKGTQCWWTACDTCGVLLLRDNSNKDAECSGKEVLRNPCVGNPEDVTKVPSTVAS